MRCLPFLAVISSQLLSASAAGPPTDFYVSPHGKDSWSGKLADPSQSDGPFATVRRAQEAVRDLLKAESGGRVRVVLRGGTYFLDSPLAFGPADSGTKEAPIVYAAGPGEKVVLSGGTLLAEGCWEQLNGRRLWMVHIPEVKAGAWRFRQLFVNGKRSPRTRVPKKGEYQIEALPGYTGDFLRSPTKQFVPGLIGNRFSRAARTERCAGEVQI